MNDGLSIIIPTYNRPAHVERCISYFEAVEAPCEIVISDGSRTEIAATVGEAVRRARRNLRIQHFSAPDSPMHWRIAEGMRRTNTPYVAVQADDDFIFVSSAVEACRVLNQRHEFLSCQGPMLFLTHPITTAGHRNLYPHFPVDAATALQRAKDHMHYYSPTIFSVTRREAAIRAYDHGGDSVFPAIDELTATLLLVAQGRTCAIDRIYGFREQNPSQGGYHDSGWQDILIHPSFSERYATMARKVAAAVLEFDGESDEIDVELEVRRTAMLAIRDWFNGNPPPPEPVRLLRERQDRLVHQSYDGLEGALDTELSPLDRDMRAVLQFL